MTFAQFLIRCLPALLCMGALQPARADFELKDSAGRAILLKDDGTWRYTDAPDKPTDEAATKPATAPQDLADLALERRTDIGGGCMFTLALTNRLPYEIRSLVPEFVVQRSNGVTYTSQGLGFGPVKPGDRYQRDLRILGIGCADIGKLKLTGGDRCDMGDLNKFSDAKGECLARVRVLPSELISFEK